MGKTIYFVRHGESESNASSTVHGPDALLTARGREQASYIAERATKLPFKAIVSSELPRARETADIISARTGVPVETAPHFGEWRTPSARVGLGRADAVFLEIERQVRENFGRPGWRHSDEENFDDLSMRARNAFAYLEARPEDELLVVTHGFFLRVLAALAVLRDSLDSASCHAFLRAFETENSGLSVFSYDPSRIRNPWHVIIWNDQTHLG